MVYEVINFSEIIIFLIVILKVLKYNIFNFFSTSLYVGLKLFFHPSLTCYLKREEDLKLLL